MPAPLPLPLLSSQDLFAKLQRDAALLVDDEVTTDRFFNFVITGYSLIDWVKVDASLAGIDTKRLREESMAKDLRRPRYGEQTFLPQQPPANHR